MASSQAGKLQNFIEKFTYRNQGAITIPKSGDGISLARETCYKLTVDVVVESVTQQQYRNFRSLPYSGFYGYATLVKRDCIDPKIELNFGRNRIFEQRISEAFVAWNNLAFYLNTEQKYLFDILSFITNSGEITIPQLCGAPPFPFNFSETDLREVYVKCVEDTQFYIELAWTAPVTFTDDCNNQHDGKSNEPDDPEKDKGLPPEGSQPKKNAPSSPWSGNNPFSPPPMGSPYANSKASTDENGNPLNSSSNNSGINGEDPDFTRPPDPEGTIYWIEFTAIVSRPEFSNPCGQRTTKQYIQILDDSITGSVANTGQIEPPVPNGCGSGTTAIYGLRLSGGDGSFATYDFHDNGMPSISKGSGLALPPTSVTFS